MIAAALGIPLALGLLVFIARLDAGSSPANGAPAVAKPVPAKSVPASVSPPKSQEPDPSPVEPAAASALEPESDSPRPDYSQMSEWELEAEADRMAEEGRAELERLEEAKLEAQFAEACAADPSLPFC